MKQFLIVAATLMTAAALSCTFNAGDNQPKPCGCGDSSNVQTSPVLNPVQDSVIKDSVTVDTLNSK